MDIVYTIFIFVRVVTFACVQVVHPTLNKDFLSDTAWTFSMYLESMAIVPQLFMFQKQAKGIVEVLVRPPTQPMRPFFIYIFIFPSRLFISVLLFSLPPGRNSDQGSRTEEGSSPPLPAAKE